MPITWRLGAGYTSGVDYNTASGAAATSGTLNKPTGLVDGQTLRAYFYSQTSTGAVATAPSGWTLEVGPPSRRGGIYRKYIASAAAETATSYTWSTAASGRWAGVIWLSDGEDSTTPVNDVSSYSTETTSPTVASITSTKTDALEAVFAYWNNSSTNVTTVSQASTTKLIEVASPNTSATSGIAIFTNPVTSTGTVGSRNLTGSPTPTNMAGVHFVYTAAPATPSRTAEGVITLGGTAVASAGGTGVTATGGVTLGGAAAVVEREIAVATGGVTLSGSASASKMMQYIPQTFSISQMDQWIAKGYPVHWAHRGGSQNWSEMTMFAYRNAVDHGARALEVSVHRSSDGVWIMSHDPNLSRVTGSNLTISSTNSSAMLGLPVTAPSGGGVIGRLEDVLTEFPDRVLLVDNKPGSFFSNFLDLLETVPNNKDRIIVKLDGEFGTLANFQAAKARGFKTAGYWYPNNYAANLPSRAPYTDYIGMQYDATSGQWADIFAYGKPVWGHVLLNSTQFNQAKAAGVQIYQDADVVGLMPKWNVAYSTDGTTLGGSASAANSFIGADAANRATSSVLEVFTGSSTTAGLNATTPDNRWNWKVADYARAAYPQTNSQTATFGSIAELQQWIAQNGALPNGLHWLGAGVSGTSSASWLSTADVNALIALQPKRIFITIGSNDYQSGRPPATYQSNIEAKMATLRSGIPGVQFVLVHSYQRMDVTTPAYPWSDYRDALIAIANANPSDTIFINNDPAFVAVGIPGADPNGYMSFDNVHLDNEGHDFLGTVSKAAFGIPDAATPLASPPDMVRNVSVGSAAGFVRVSWTTLPDATGYTIQYRPGTSGGWTNVTGTNPAGTDVTGLTNDQAYQFRVFATNANGDGLPSVTANGTPVADNWLVMRSDSFNRPDGALGSFDGGVDGPTPWEGTTSPLQVVSNEMRIGTPGSFVAGYTPRTTGQGIRLKVTSLAAGSQFFLNLRRAPTSFGTATSRYMCYMNASTGSLVVQKQVAGSTTTLASGGVAGTLAVGDIWEFRVLGSTLEVLINGFVTWSLVDSSVTGVGVMAISGTSALTSVGVDDIKFLEYIPATTAAGGVTLGGTSSAVAAFARTASGNVTLGGSPATSQVEGRTATGGVTLSGVADGQAAGGTPSRTATGGVALSGTAPAMVVMSTTAGGTVILGGTGSGTEREFGSASGGVILGGMASAYASLAATATGYVTLSGTGITPIRVSVTASGTIILSGSGLYTPVEGYPSIPASRSITALAITRSITQVTQR